MTPFRPMPDLPDGLEDTDVSHARPTEAQRLVARLGELGWTVGVAESLTGGLVVSSIVGVPGASGVLRGGVVAYATDLKTTLLGVDETLLSAHGPVHPRVAQQMAEGVRRTVANDGTSADVGIATTGIAGPVSPDGQPVGTVHIGIATPLGSRVRSVQLSGDRADIRLQATVLAVRFALEAL
ncbi:CinA family protein [Microbacterium dextranolyticum]|uniref:Competence protein n=1 Tax=Microbacterium dextranolyticum TaxID=36806 RepID=A0A9W6M6R3_9MICO|nr:CinA family protein [Microbacterium dextranolyticum]MBM7462418.1 nicotinamide-nucleotide amidase [Microbacterium dextranolyticum]GLJ96749.1 competence protein [Microbacterium dextranolyticum]